MTFLMTHHWKVYVFISNKWLIILKCPSIHLSNFCRCRRSFNILERIMRNRLYIKHTHVYELSWYNFKLYKRLFLWKQFFSNWQYSFNIIFVGYESMTFSLFNNKTSLQTIILYIMIIATFIFVHRLAYIDIALPLLDAFRLARLGTDEPLGTHNILPL